MYILIGIFAFWLVLLATITRFEKRLVWPYGDPEAQPPFPDSSGYGARWLEGALSAGFTFLGWCRHLKGGGYRVSFALLVSPERDCFVVISIGTILGLALRGTCIYTRSVEGRVFYTTDNQSCIEIDVARQWLSQLAPTNTFTKLLQRHRDMLRASRITPQPFTPGREAQEFKTMRLERYESMSRKGLIEYTDHSGMYWRYTYWVALKLAVINYSIGLLRGVTQGRIPRIA